MSLPTISCILPTYNRCDVVERTLGSLLACDYPRDRFEILVADNSTDATPGMVRRVAATADVPVRLVWRNERLPAVKRNQALRLAEGELALFMNDDLWVRPDFLREHARTHADRADDGPIAVLGHVEQSPQMPATPFIRWYRPFAYDEIADRADERVGWKHFWSMNLSLPRGVMLERNLLFHEDWREIGHEDVELGYRWTRAGLPVIYNPRAWGEHYHPHDLESACRLQASIGRGLRDLESLIPEPRLLERYGVFSWRNSPRSIVRGALRRLLFNARTVPPLQRWLTPEGRDTAVARWLYWKIMLHHTERAYTATAARRPRPAPTAAAQRGAA